MATKQRTGDEHNVIFVSDIHSGCRLSLCPPQGVRLDHGGTYMPSAIQQKMWAFWRHCWDEWLPEVLDGLPTTIIFNGDAIDGRHHGSTTQWSQNLEDQKNCAYEILKPEIDRHGGDYYHIRGTEAHVGQSGENEESLARMLEAKRNQHHEYARFELFLQMGKGDGSVLVHAMHHIGTTGSMAYESTAVMKELVESFAEAGRFGVRPPDVVVRSHRHRNIEIRIPTSNQKGISLVTPAWQLKNSFVYKIAGGRLSTPQLGLCVLCKRGRTFYTESHVHSVDRPSTVVI